MGSLPLMLFSWFISIALATFKPLTLNFILLTLYMGAIGSSAAYMILAVNSWMQVPWGTGSFVAQTFLPWVPVFTAAIIALEIAILLAGIWGIYMIYFKKLKVRHKGGVHY